MEIHLDLETFSPVNIKGNTTEAYAEPAEILIIAYAFDTGEVRQWSVLDGCLPEELIFALGDPNSIILAHNARFERTMLNNKYGQMLGIPPLGIDRFFCTAALCANHGLPRSLEKAAIALNLPSEHLKDKKGKALIKKFSVPRRPTQKDPSTRHFMHSYPEDAAAFIEYCRQDVVVQRQIYFSLKKYL